MTVILSVRRSERDSLSSRDYCDGTEIWVSMKIRGFTVCTTLSSILEVFTSRPSVQIGWLQNRRNLLQGTNLVDRNPVIVGQELNNCELELIIVMNC
jgi:hypothetical protein